MDLLNSLLRSEEWLLYFMELLDFLDEMHKIYMKALLLPMEIYFY